MLLSAQLPAPHGLSKSALYISTEAPLATTRLAQLLSQHPRLTSLPPSSKPSLSRILSIQTPDLESQDHILRYQLPVAIQRHNVGLVVLDSVAANYRAEFERRGGSGGGGGGGGGSEKDGGSSRRAVGEAMAHRTAQLVQLGALLRSVARTHGVAVVVANQVSDRFSAAPPPPPPPSSTTTSRHPSYNSTISQTSRVPTPGPGPPSQQGGVAAAAAGATSTPPPPPLPGTAPTAVPLTLSRDPLTLDHQQRWFTGWGDARISSSASEGAQNLKTPALGLVWANQIAARIALLKAPVYNVPNPWIGLAADGRVDWRGEGGDGDEEGGGGGTEIKRWRRWMKVVFAPWAPPSVGRGVEYVIRGRGVVAAAAVAGGGVEEGKAKAKAAEVGEEEEEEEKKGKVEEKNGEEDEVEEEGHEEQVKEGEDSPAGEQQPRAGSEPLADSS